MARIPLVPIQDFQLGGAPSVVTSTGADLRGLNHLGRVLTQKGLSDAAEQARQEGISAQATIRDGTLAKRDSRFFGFFDKAFDEGAKYLYQKQKQLQIDSAVQEAALNNPFDPEGFTAEMQEKQSRILAGVPGDVMPGVKLYWDNQNQNTGFAIREDAVKREFKFQQQQVALDYDTLIKQAENELEATGELSEITEGSLGAMRERMGEMGFTPAEMEVYESNGRDRMFVATMANEYRSLDAEGRAEFRNTLWDEDGPLGDLAIAERVTIAQKLQWLFNRDKAQLATGVGNLKRLLRDIIAVGKKNNSLEGEEGVLAHTTAVIAAGGGGQELINLRDDAARTIATREYGNTLRGNNPSVAKATHGRLEALGRDGFKSRTEAEMFDMSADIIAELADANANGTYLDYIMENNITMPDEYNQLETRLEKVRYLQNHYGEPLFDAEGNAAFVRPANVNYFTQGEIDNMKNIWETGGTAERIALLGQIQADLGAAQEFQLPALRQIGKNSNQLAVVASFLSDPEKSQLGTSIMAGMEFLETDGASLVEKPTKAKTQLQARFQNLFPTPGSTTAEGYAQVAFALWADKVRRTGKSAAITATDINTMVKEVLGGEPWTLESGFEAVPLMPGFNASQNRNVWRATIDDDILEMNDGEFPVDVLGNAVNANRIKNEARLVPDGIGTFIVMMPGAANTQDDWTPLRNPKTNRVFLYNPSVIDPRRVGQLDQDFEALNLSP